MKALENRKKRKRRAKKTLKAIRKRQRDITLWEKRDKGWYYNYSRLGWKLWGDIPPKHVLG